MAHQINNLTLLKPDVEQVEGQGETEGIKRGVLRLGAAAALRRFDKSKGAGWRVAKPRDVEIPVEVEQALDPGLEDGRRPVSRAARERERAPERPFDLPPPVGDVAYNPCSEKKFRSGLIYSLIKKPARGSQ